MVGSLVVRAVTRADFARWEPLWKGYNAFYERPVFPAEIARMTWSRFFDAYEPMHALVAEQGGTLLGLAHYLFHRSAIVIPPVCYLQDLFTRADARGTGVGRALIEGVHAAARAAGSPRVYWQTHETNRTAMRLYDQVAERSGFVLYRKAIAIP